MKKELNLILGVCTYKRLGYLVQLLNSFRKYKNKEYKYTLVIHNDCLNDQEFFLLLDRYEDLEIYVFESNRQGIHVAKNKILRFADKKDFDYLMIVEDDIYFKDHGFEDCYIDAINKSGYKYLCFFDPSWKNSIKGEYIIKEHLQLQSYCSAINSQGAFAFMTKEVIKKIGYYDVPTMGVRGIGHLDYAVRSAKEGLNDINTFYDALSSERYIGMQKEDYKHSLSEKEILYHRSLQHTKLNVLKTRKVNYIIYNI